MNIASTQPGGTDPDYSHDITTSNTSSTSRGARNRTPSSSSLGPRGLNRFVAVPERFARAAASLLARPAAARQPRNSGCTDEPVRHSAGLPLASLQRYRVDMAGLLQGRSLQPQAADGTRIFDGRHYARIGDEHVEVIPDRAASVRNRLIWRVVTPGATRSGRQIHRLAYDPRPGVWRCVEPPGLRGGGAVMARHRPPAPHVLLNQRDPAHDLRYQRALLDNVRDTVTPAELARIKTLLDLCLAHPAGAAILRGLRALHDLADITPGIHMIEAEGPGQRRPRLRQPCESHIWHFDLRELTQAPIGTVVAELAAVYNNMTGIVGGGPPYADRFADRFADTFAGRRADEALETAWEAWAEEDDVPPSPNPLNDDDAQQPTGRQAIIQRLRQTLHEMRCYGGIDRSAFRELIRMAGTGAQSDSAPPRTTIKLSSQALTSIPPLPDDIEELDVSHNPILDWSNLPRRLAVLNAAGTHMISVPQNLPNTLVDLDLSGNLLAILPERMPPGLQRLNLRRNRISSLPRLPHGLRELSLRQNVLRDFPFLLPDSIETLDLHANRIQRITSRLPSSLRDLDISTNQIALLPARLPDRLHSLLAGRNRICVLPALPESLRVLDLQHNGLASLPEELPSQLRKLLLDFNPLLALPEGLPDSLRWLSVTSTRLRSLPSDIRRLSHCVIDVARNDILPRSIPGPIPGSGPVFRSLATPGAPDRLPAPVSLHGAVLAWLEAHEPEAAMRWEAIGVDVGDDPAAAAFRSFLERLRATVNFQDGAFRQDVRQWLAELSLRDSAALRAVTFAACFDATESCEDRVSWTMNELRALRLNHDIERGLYDYRPQIIVDAGRQMYRLQVLAELARQKVVELTEASRVVDEIEVFLAYCVQLRDELDLRIVVPKMRFFAASGVRGSEVSDALSTVRSREAAHFDEFFAMDYAPWRTLLARRFPIPYAAAERQVGYRLESDFERELTAEIEKLDIDPADTVTLEGARHNLGPAVMRRIAYTAMGPLTRRLLDRLGVQ